MLGACLRFVCITSDCPFKGYLIDFFLYCKGSYISANEISGNVQVNFRLVSIFEGMFLAKWGGRLRGLILLQIRNTASMSCSNFSF